MKNYYGIIYKATNKVNGKSYIGQTTKPLSIRKSIHLSCARNKLDNIYFHNAIRKYGEKAFNWKSLMTAFSQEELNALENQTIKKYDSINKGYNVIEGGNINPVLYGEDNPRYGVKLPYTVRKKIKEAQIGENGYWYRKEFSENHRRNISKALKGKKKSKRHAENISKAFGAYWLVEYPNGDYKIIKSLAKFCRENGLGHGHMVAVSLNKRNHHKGYKCIKLNEDIIRRI